MGKVGVETIVNGFMGPKIWKWRLWEFTHTKTYLFDETLGEALDRFGKKDDAYYIIRSFRDITPTCNGMRLIITKPSKNHSSIRESIEEEIGHAAKIPVTIK